MPEIRFELADTRFKADPHATYARLRAEAPVFRSRLGRGRPVWLVTRDDDVAALLRDPRFAKDPAHARSGDAPWMPGFLRPLTRNMLDLDAPDHTRLRSLVQKAFTPRLVERLRPRVESLADELLARVRGGRMELVRDYALPVPLTIIGELLGFRPRTGTASTAGPPRSSPRRRGSARCGCCPRCGPCSATCAPSSPPAAPIRGTT